MATILIVDDRAANREVLVTLLRYKGHRLLEAEDGARGLAVARAERPDLVITDVLMPVMDGFELVRRLRVDPATSATRVIFYTAHYSEREARTLALASGIAWILTKPIEPEEALSVVGRVLAGESETGAARPDAALTTEFDRDHLQLVTDKLSQTTEDLRASNARLRGLVNVGLELASEGDAGQLLNRVCASALDLFGATYVTLGIVDRSDRTLTRLVICGADAEEWIKKGDAIPGILQTVVADRRPLRGHNVGGSPATLGLPSLHPTIEAFLTAPIASPAHVYGWICLAGNEGRTFTASDEQLLLALSGQVGRIYENGYFYAVAQRRAAELELQILEREQVELALRRERDRAKQYLDTADVMLVAIDLKGRVTLINRKGCDLLGWSESELLGRHWLETWIPLEEREAMSRTFEDVKASDSSIVENTVVTRSGEKRLIEWRNTALRDDSGRVIGMFGSGTDVTERNATLEALRTAEERMRFALESADVGIWDMNYATGVLQWSETLERQYGVKPGTFAGTFDAFIDRVHPDDRESLLATVEHATRTGTDFSTRSRAAWPDGTVRWLEGAGRVLINERGEPVRGIGISRDVTERRTLEEQYHQAQKMEAIGRLAGGVAHDFNNLLTVILGFCELLLSDLDPEDARQPDIVEIQKAGTRAAALTRQLLAFSRKQIVEPTVLDLNTVVADMRAMLTRLIGEDVAILVRLAPDLARVKADRGQMEQIVMNLAINARDAMPQGGTLTIETANAVIGQRDANGHAGPQPGPCITLTVRDTGTGIPPEIKARLFEPFFTTKELGKGTGLGLATVHGIVEGYGGHVGVESDMGTGSSFTVYLPTAVLADVPIEAPAPAPKPRAASQTVLVVDDAEGVCELARRLLQRQGYKVLTASNADDARKIFEAHPSIDVLLTDVVMPGASGPELTLQLIAQRPELRVIYMSGYTEETIVHHGVLDPGIAFLNKPFTSETLGRKIRESLGG
jgi:PAS domain S-box-containing protein